MPLALQLGFIGVTFAALVTSMVLAIRADLSGPAHRITGKAAATIMLALIGFVWLGYFLKGAPVLQAIGLVLMLAADVAMIYPLRILIQERRERRASNR